MIDQDTIQEIYTFAMITVLDDDQNKTEILRLNALRIAARFQIPTKMAGQRG